MANSNRWYLLPILPILVFVTFIVANLTALGETRDQIERLRQTLGPENDDPLLGSLSEGSSNDVDDISGIITVERSRYWMDPTDQFYPFVQNLMDRARQTGLRITDSSSRESGSGHQWDFMMNGTRNQIMAFLQGIDEQNEYVEIPNLSIQQSPEGYYQMRLSIGLPVLPVWDPLEPEEMAGAAEQLDRIQIPRSNFDMVASLFAPPLRISRSEIAIPATESPSDSDSDRDVTEEVIEDVDVEFIGSYLNENSQPVVVIKDLESGRIKSLLQGVESGNWELIDYSKEGITLRIGDQVIELTTENE